MVSNALHIRVMLTAASAVVLVVMIFINIHAMRHNVSRDIGREGFLRMLERSVDYSSGAVDDGEGDIDGDDLVGGDLPDMRGGAIPDGEDVKLGRINTMEENFATMEREISALRSQLNDMMAGKEKADKQEKETAKMQPQPESRPETAKMQPQPESRPEPEKRDLTGMNILLLYADDWTHSTLSSFHKTEPLNTVVKTPVLDALASDGVRFTHNCVTTSVCWISRATLYTGQYMSRHGTKEPCCWSGIKKPKEKLKEAPANWKELSFYEILSRAGYHVGHAGKWGVYLPWDKEVHFNVEEDGWHLRKHGKKLWHITEKNEADALRFLVTRDRSKPFFLNVAFFATHAKDSDVRQYMPQNASMSWYANDTIPIPPTGTNEAWRRMPWFFDDKNEGRARWRWRFQNYTMHQTMMKNYYRMATEVDSACGVILEELRRQEVLDKTVIIFTTDNGNFHSEHGLADKWYPHQESIRVPLIVRDPRMKGELKGTTNSEFTLNIDLAPTILSLAGLPAPEPMMGRDMSHLWLSPNDPEVAGWREDFFYEHPIISHKNFIPSSEALVRKDYKYMYWPDWGHEQLFDLVNDPVEMEDIINSTDPKVVKVKEDMKRRFKWLKSLVKSEGRVKV